MSKDYKQEFDTFLSKIKNKENFAFSRFSDGELFIMKNDKVVLAPGFFITGTRVGHNVYTKEEQKEFIPGKHEFYRQKLIESFQFKHENYYKGICTKTDVGEEDFQWQLDLQGSTNIDNLTFANLFINSNYPRYVEEVVPLFSDREVIYIVNENADLSGLPFEVKKDFRIGSSCMVNDYDTVEKVKNYISSNNITDHLILCSAASLSNFIIHECFKENSNNTFLDIGSSLNPYQNLEGWKFTRGYLTSYWMKSSSAYGQQIDQW
jgi:hypothetical protein